MVSTGGLSDTVDDFKGVKNNTTQTASCWSCIGDHKKDALHTALVTQDVKDNA